MTFGFTRDSALLWFLAFAAVVAYLAQVGTPPWYWDYKQWLAFATFISGWLIGKMQTSDLRHSEYGRAKFTPDDRTSRE